MRKKEYFVNAVMPKQYCFRVKAKSKKAAEHYVRKNWNNLQKTEVKGSPYDTRTTNVTHGRILLCKKSLITEGGA